MNETEKYYALIKNWHSKASEEDYFSKFIFQYLAFIAFLRTQWKTESEISGMKGNTGKITDRDYIQALKRDSYFNDFWIDLTLRSTKDRETVSTLNKLTSFLKKEPLQSDDRWWNFDDFDLSKKRSNREKTGIIRNPGDFSNLVEFWYSVRNNLFHGNKNPSLKRDQDLVCYAFITLHFFVERILLVSHEIHRVYPAKWDEFWEKFKKGEAEITTKEDNTGAVGNIYECAFLEEFRYPLLLLDKSLTRDNIVAIINEELFVSGELAPRIWSRIKYAAGNKKSILKRDFGLTIDSLKKVYGFDLDL